MSQNLNVTEEQKQRALYQAALQDVKRILGTDYGQRFLKYLLESLDFGQYPDIGTPENILYDKLGFLRAGQSVFQLIAVADPELAGYLVGQIEKGRYANKD